MNSRQQLALPAFLAAAPAALVLWFASYYAYVHVFHGMAHAAGMVPYLLMGALLFGAPLVLGVLALIAWPGFLLLRLTIGVTLPATIAAGAVCGLIAREAARRLWAEPELSFLPVPVVLFTGIGTAWIWWRLWRSRSRIRSDRDRVSTATRQFRER